MVLKVTNNVATTCAQGIGAEANMENISVGCHYVHQGENHVCIRVNKSEIRRLKL